MSDPKRRVPAARVQRLHPDSLPSLGRPATPAAPTVAADAEPAGIEKIRGWVSPGRNVHEIVPNAPKVLRGWTQDGNATAIYSAPQRIVGERQPIELERGEFQRLQRLGYVQLDEPPPPPPPDAPREVGPGHVGRVSGVPVA